MKSLQRAGAVACVAAGFLLGSVPASATAATRYAAVQNAADSDIKAVRAWACFDGSALPSSIVAEYGSPSGQSLKMRCGDPTKGVVHVDLDHEITEQTADAFQNCLSDTIQFGGYNRPGSNPSLSVWRWQFGPGRGDAAEFVYESANGEGITFYTTGVAPGNEWQRCAGAR